MPAKSRDVWKRELEAYGPYEIVTLTSIEPLHEVKSFTRLERLTRHMLARGCWGGRPVLVERRRAVHDDDMPGRLFTSWTASHRLAAAFCAQIWLVPVIEIDLAKWVRVHGEVRTAAVSETYDDETRLAMLLAAGDERAARLMAKECPKNFWENDARRAPRPDPGEGPPWLAMGPNVHARKVGRLVQVRAPGGGVEEFSSRLLAKLAEVGRGRFRPARTR